MNNPSEIHVPTPEFRASLEREIEHTFRREQQLAPSMRATRTLRLRHARTLMIGLMLGAGAGIASAQVQDARQRDSLSLALSVERQLAAVKLDLARANYDLVRKQFEMGAASRESLLNAERELREIAARLARLELDQVEIRATSASPRDELWAPLINGRDFVKERLNLDALGAQQRALAQERALAEAERAFSSGTLSQMRIREAELDLFRARSESDVAAMKLSLRQKFLDAGILADELSHQLQRFEALKGVEQGAQQLRLAQDRLKMLRDRHAVGTTVLLDVKRAEVEVLERQLNLEQLQRQLQIQSQRIRKE